jgi:hypothetical protein
MQQCQKRRLVILDDRTEFLGPDPKEGHITFGDQINLTWFLR